jgi:adenylyltransferase/sulfurtransferase
MSLLQESRYDRQERISWWDQSLLRAGKVLVVGAGALGNEIVKNLTLLGVGEIHVVDMDLIEHTNLARCVFFKDGDEGKAKADVLAAGAASLNSDVSLVSHVMPVQFLGSGYLSKFDVIVGGLDNREARLWVNRACRRLGTYWVDGAIEGLHGVVQSFWRTGPCYECTLTEVDWKILSHRRSCALLGIAEMQQGKTPTNVTTASLVAAVQVQEVIKYLVKKDDILALIGKQWHLLGETMTNYVVSIDEDINCMAHENALDISLEINSPATLRQVATQVSVPNFIAIDLNDDLLTLDPCEKCKVGGVTGLRSVLSEGSGVCNSCGESLKVFSRTSISTEDPALDLPFDSILWSKCELLYVRNSDTRAGVLVWRDK